MGTGVTLSIFYESGQIPKDIEEFIMLVNGTDNCSAHIFTGGCFVWSLGWPLMYIWYYLMTIKNYMVLKFFIVSVMGLWYECNIYVFFLYKSFNFSTLFKALWGFRFSIFGRFKASATLIFLYIVLTHLVCLLFRSSLNFLILDIKISFLSRAQGSRQV